MIKRYILFLVLSFTVTQISLSQEWMTSLDAAKRIALVQDKMLLMVWEDAALIPYPVVINDETGIEVTYDDLFSNEVINRVLWKYFVPVKVNEELYAQLYAQIKDTRNGSYIRQFKDDNLKVMDVNYNIVNTSLSPEAYFNLSEFLGVYALNTSFFKAELTNYSEQKDFSTTFRLASKYMDYAILVHPKIRKDIINLSITYLNEADGYLLGSDLENKINFEYKSSLLRMSQYLIQNRPRKVLRQLKKFKNLEIDDANQSLVAFLYYTAYKLKKDKKNAELWKGKVSLVNLKKAELIAKTNL